MNRNANPTSSLARWILSALALAAATAAGPPLSGAEALDPALLPVLEAKTKLVQTWAAHPSVVAAVRAHNSHPSPESLAMNQARWKTSTVLDPFVRSFTKTPAATYLKSVRSPSMTEAFVSGANGAKVAFLSKPTHWSHHGKPKHDIPMTGHSWRGEVELDDSTGRKQVQIAVPVLEAGKPVGSLVVGFDISKLPGE